MRTLWAGLVRFSPRRVVSSLDQSLRRLRTDHLDLFQVHDVEFGNVQPIIDETVPTLRKLKERGKVRYIGVTGYPLPALIRIAQSVPVDTILSYCRYNLLITDMDRELTPFARERDRPHQRLGLSYEHSDRTRSPQIGILLHLRSAMPDATHSNSAARMAPISRKLRSASVSTILDVPSTLVGLRTACAER